MITRQRIEEKRQKRLGLYYLIQEDDWDKNPEKAAEVVKYTEATGLGNVKHEKITRQRPPLPRMWLNSLTRGNFLYLKSKGYTNAEIAKSLGVNNWRMRAWVKEHDVVHNTLKKELATIHDFSEEDMKLPFVKKAQ
ncbi:hypothetical protein [Enterococcus sp. LJL90]